MAANVSCQDAEVLEPVHPGEVLLEEFLKPLGVTPYRLAAALHVPRTRVERLVRCEVGLSTDTALRLARALGTTPEFWLNLQAQYDLASPAIRAAARLDAIEPLRAPEMA